jgi:hypothetical protein
MSTTTQESTNVSHRKQSNLRILWNPKTCHFSSNSPLSNPNLNKFNKDTIITPYLPVLQAWTRTHVRTHSGGTPLLHAQTRIHTWG